MVGEKSPNYQLASWLFARVSACRSEIGSLARGSILPQGQYICLRHSSRGLQEDGFTLAINGDPDVIRNTLSFSSLGTHSEEKPPRWALPAMGRNRRVVSVCEERKI